MLLLYIDLFLCLPDFRVGDKIFLGAHNEFYCQESEGCKEVQIIQIWKQEYYMIIGNLDNDIALVKYISKCLFIPWVSLL